MTDADLARWEALCNAAADGPWVALRHPECQIEPHVHQVKRKGGRYTIASPVHSNDATMRNMEFIAAAREAMPALIAEVRRLRVLLSGEPYDEATWVAWHNRTCCEQDTQSVPND